MLLSNRRRTIRVKERIGGFTYHFTLGYSDDGRVAEIFIDSSKVGSDTKALMSSLGRLISISLQADLPIEDVCRALQDGSDMSVASAITKLLQENAVYKENEPCQE
jgi:hypothetical protein